MNQPVNLKPLLQLLIRKQQIIGIENILQLFTQTTHHKVLLELAADNNPEVAYYLLDFLNMFKNEIMKRGEPHEHALLQKHLPLILTPRIAEHIPATLPASGDFIDTFYEALSNPTNKPEYNNHMLRLLFSNIKIAETHCRKHPKLVFDYFFHKDNYKKIDPAVANALASSLLNQYGEDLKTREAQNKQYRGRQSSFFGFNIPLTEKKEAYTAAMESIREKSDLSELCAKHRALREGRLKVLINHYQANNIEVRSQQQSAHRIKNK